MADHDVGDAGFDVRKPSGSPVRDDSCTTGGGLAGRVRPSIDEHALHVSLGRSQVPVAWHTLHTETGFRKTSRGGFRGVRAGGRTAESFVRSLMTVEQNRAPGRPRAPGVRRTSDRCS